MFSYVLLVQLWTQPFKQCCRSRHHMHLLPRLLLDSCRKPNFH